MNKIKDIIFIFIAIIISLLGVYFFNDNTSYYGAQQTYRVYLKGKSIALIKNKEDLENYIDHEQQELKDKYNVSKVYIPDGLEIKQELTYNEKLMEENEVYELIKDKEPFTIDGYVITIGAKEIIGDEGSEEASQEETQVEEKVIYVLEKEIFEEAIDNTIYAFLDEEKYQLYLDEEQEEIKALEEGEIIENVFIKERITIKKDHIPVDKDIFTDSKSLAQYLLYGSIDGQKTYSVKTGDTIENIANKNKLNVREFLIANRNISSENTLLYEGQTVVVAPVNPIFTLVEETKEAVLQEKAYKTEIKEDNNYYVGYTEVVQAGVKGEELVTRNVRKENGKVTNVINISTVETKAPINRVVKTGSRTQFAVGNTGIWAWPTLSGYYISTYYGHDNSLGYYRFHEALDIAGLGCNSPIYSANDGTVVIATYNSSLGNYVEINHNNGYKTVYAHLNSISVKVGQAVEMGQVIGRMGNTGYSFGCHLHFVAKKNNSTFDPFQLYR